MDRSPERSSFVGTLGQLVRETEGATSKAFVLVRDSLLADYLDATTRHTISARTGCERI